MHKPPIIYYLNALGLILTKDSRWGVWLLEFVGLFLAVWIGFSLIKSRWKSCPAFFSSVTWLLSLFFVLDGGNLTEEYVLPIQFGCLWLIYDADKPGRDRYWHYYLIGCLTGLAFFVKQTSLGISLAIVIFLVAQGLSYHQWIKIFKKLFVRCAVIINYDTAHLVLRIARCTKRFLGFSFQI